ncbi:MAG TPA: hypothetical protein ENJ56_04550 [Anaerolineae bacterium]|nr:hypothetical protein [Anaerolineae bacterium]
MRKNVKRWRAIEARLGRESEIWLSTVRYDGRPHLVPVWFVYLDSKIYFCTGTETQKWVNLLSNQSVALSLADPNKVVVIEGEGHAVGHQVTQELAEHFYNKYEWDLREDNTAHWRVVEVTIHKVLAWGDGLEEKEGIRVL